MKWFRNRRTSKADVIMAIAGALIGVWKAHDTYKQFVADEAVEELEKEQKK